MFNLYSSNKFYFNISAATKADHINLVSVLFLLVLFKTAYSLPCHVLSEGNTICTDTMASGRTDSNSGIGSSGADLHPAQNNGSSGPVYKLKVFIHTLSIIKMFIQHKIVYSA